MKWEIWSYVILVPTVTADHVCVFICPSTLRTTGLYTGRVSLMQFRHVKSWQTNEQIVPNFLVTEFFKSGGYFVVHSRRFSSFAKEILNNQVENFWKMHYRRILMGTGMQGHLDIRPLHEQAYNNADLLWIFIRGWTIAVYFLHW